MTHRTITAIRRAPREDVAHLMTHQAIGGEASAAVNPFLLLAHHGPQVFAPGNSGLPFGPHPHRGFETVTFIRAGSLAHHDTGGHESVIEAGGVQWMTAGSGLIHAEVSPAAFKRQGGLLEILQLWVNLPGRLKMVVPRYTGIQAAAIPEIAVDDGGARLALVAGSIAGVEGPIASLTGVFMSTVAFDAAARVVLPAPAARTILFYVVAGALTVAGRGVEAGDLVTFADDGNSIEVSADGPAWLLYAHADPIDEPVVSRGPFVMTSEAEIDQAFRDHRSGQFDGTPISLELD